MTAKGLREQVQEQNKLINSLTEENNHLRSKVEMLQNRLETFGKVSNMLIEVKNQREELDFELNKIKLGRRLGLE